jgi:hypothetical protein
LPVKAVCVLAVLALTACDGAGSRPMSPTSPTSPAPSGSTFLAGWAHDPVGRPLARVLLEIVDGPRAGRRTMSNERGEFQFDGGPSGAVTLRASRADLASTTVTTRWSTNPHERTRVTLKPLEPPLAIVPGTYTMMLISDPLATGWFGATCSGFPPELLRRTYEATLSPATLFEGFEVRFTSPTLITLPGPFGFGFALSQAGAFVGFELELGFGSGPTEALSDHRYLTVSGVAPTSEPATLTDHSVTIPFSGTFEYCQLTAPMGGYNACNQVPAAERLEYHVCSSSQDQMVFTKR